MRGAGTLRNIIGKPLYGKKKKQQQQEEEADLHEAPAKKQKLRKASSIGATGAVGQRSIFNFFSVAAAPATAAASPSQDSLVVVQTQPTVAEHGVPPRCKSAPVQRSDTPNSTPAPESPDTSSKSSDRASSPPGNNQTFSQQQQQQQSASPWVSAQPSGPLLVTTRVVGRQHQSAPWPPGPGCQLLLQREPGNPVDPCAVLVCSVDSFGIRRTHGHLPAAVSCHLAPLMYRGDVTLQVQLGQHSAAAAAEEEEPSTVSRSSTPEVCEGAAAAAGCSDTAAAAAAAPAAVPTLEPAAAAAVSDPAGMSQLGSRDMSREDPAAEAVGDVDGPVGDVDAPLQQHQEQQLLQLQVVVLPGSAPDAAAAAALAAVDRAVSAGLDSVAPGRSSGAMLAAAFEHIISETRKHDLHLLSQQEQAVLQHMQVLPAAAKALLLRLLLRKRTWFQLATLAYADVPQPDTAASRLSAVGLLQWGSDASADLNSLLQELPVVVLKQVLAGLLPKGHPAVQQATAAAAAAGGGYAAPSKAVLISSIQANACRVRLQAAITAAAGPCVAVTPAAADTFARLQLLYFASPGHDLNMFVAVERGAVRYPAYPIQRTLPVFSSRQQVLEYEQALAAAAAVDATLEAGDTDAAWQQLQPALSALQAGVHKAIVWDEACAPLPNPPPRQQPAPAVTLAAAPTCTNTGSAVSDSPAPDQSATRQVSSAPAAAGNAQQLPSVAAAAPAAAAGTVQQLPSVAAAASSQATYTAQQPPFVAAVGPVATRGPPGVPQQPAGGPGAAGVAAVEASRLSSESGVQYVVGTAVQSVQQGPAADTGVLPAAADTGVWPAAAAAGAAGAYGVELGDLGQSVGGSPGPEVCDLTQVSSSDVSWDTSDVDGQGTAAAVAAAAAAADGANSRSPAEQQQQQQQQQACAPADCSLELASEGTKLQGPTQAAQGQQQQQQGYHQLTTCDANATMAASPAPHAAAAAGSSARRLPGGPAPPLFFARFCAGWMYASLGTVAASLLEKRKAWGEAVELLRLLLGGNACVGRRGEWWTRLAINLEHLGRTEDALEAVEAALADVWVRGGDLLGLQRRYLRLGKPPRRWRRPSWATAVGWEPPEVVITARPLNNTIGTKSRFYAPDNSLVTVEQLALQHYASQEGGCWQGLHCEGGVWTSLFTLLLWDVIFMGVPDVFRSPFQTCPLDLDTDAFYPTRRNRLEAQLSRIADGQAGAILSAVWATNAGLMARGINWQRFTQQHLLEICACVGGLGLAAVLRLMAEDYAGAAGGLPDLLLWRPADTSAKLVEVKGPRDRLSHQQRFWLAHMFNNTLQVEVLKVKEPQGSRRK